MSELLGFVVLTSPLWLIVLLLFAATWSARRVAKRFSLKRHRILAASGVFLLVLLVPFGDEIMGRAYLEHLCGSDGRLKIHQTVELPAHLWDAQGKPTFFNDKNGNFALAKQYPARLAVENQCLLLNINERVITLWDVEHERALAEKKSYTYWGGWIARNISPSSTGTSCGDELERWAILINTVFKRPNPK